MTSTLISIWRKPLLLLLLVVFWWWFSHLDRRSLMPLEDGLGDPELIRGGGTYILPRGIIRNDTFSSFFQTKLKVCTMQQQQQFKQQLLLLLQWWTHEDMKSTSLLGQFCRPLCSNFFLKKERVTFTHFSIVLKYTKRETSYALCQELLWEKKICHDNVHFVSLYRYGKVKRVLIVI